jgi:hypothetical protein
MGETGILENLTSLSLVLPDFEPRQNSRLSSAILEVLDESSPEVSTAVLIWRPCSVVFLGETTLGTSLCVEPAQNGPQDLNITQGLGHARSKMFRV